jgi:hypothetical protein
MARRQPPFPPPHGPSGTPMAVPALDDAPSPVRRTLARVMTVQVVTLLLLWLLQARYHH